MIRFLKRRPSTDHASNLTIHFNDGPFVENRSRNANYSARFFTCNRLQFEVELPPETWGKCYSRWLQPWSIEVVDSNTGAIVRHHQFDLRQRRVLVRIDSKSLGDTLAWVGQVQRFADLYPETDVYCSHYWPNLPFNASSNRLRFVSPEDTPDDIYATFDIGLYLDDWRNCHPQDPRTVPLGKIAADILSIPYKEYRPDFTHTSRQSASSLSTTPINKPYVCIATSSTAGAKLWQNKNGWQAVIDYLNDINLQPVLIQREPHNLKHLVDRSGDYPIEQRCAELRNCEFFIGLGSGLSWLAWALHKPVVLISGFSMPWAEFNTDCYRVINATVCHGCWNDPDYEFDRSDWDWCPRQTSSSDRFVCTRSITSNDVTQHIDKLLNERLLNQQQCNPTIRSVAS